MWDLNRRTCVSLARACSVASLAALLLLPLSATAKDTRPAAATPERMDLAEAIAAGDVQITVIPHKAERVTLQIANKLDRPLSIVLPTAMAASPVLAQFQFGNGGQNNGLTANGGQNAPQAVGFPGGNNTGNGAGNQQNGNGLNNPGLFNVPAGKVVKIKLPAVCLQFSRRSPNSRIPYELKPLESVASQPEVADILKQIGSGEVNRRVGQLAVWHFTGVSWKEIAAAHTEQIAGPPLPQFSAAEIDRATQLVKQLQGGAKPSASSSLVTRN